MEELATCLNEEKVEIGKRTGLRALTAAVNKQIWGTWILQAKIFGGPSKRIWLPMVRHRISFQECYSF